jgi:hypothetical protein
MSTTATVCLPKIHKAAQRTVGYLTENPLQNITVSTSDERTPTRGENRKNPMIGTDTGMLVAYKVSRGRMTTAGGFHVIQTQKESEIRFSESCGEPIAFSRSYCVGHVEDGFNIGYLGDMNGLT